MKRLDSLQFCAVILWFAVVRPPGTVVPGRPYVLLLFLYFFSPTDLRAPSADRREILPHDEKYVRFNNLGSKIWGLPSPPQKKKLGPKTCYIWPDFARLQTLTANISGTDEGIQNR